MNNPFEKMKLEDCFDSDGFCLNCLNEDDNCQVCKRFKELFCEYQDDDFEEVVESEPQKVAVAKLLLNILFVVAHKPKSRKDRDDN